MWLTAYSFSTWFSEKKHNIQHENQHARTLQNHFHIKLPVGLFIASVTPHHILLKLKPPYASIKPKMYGINMERCCYKKINKQRAWHDEVELLFPVLD